MDIQLHNVYYQQNTDTEEYKDIFFETNVGVLKSYITSLNFVNIDNLQTMKRLHELDEIKKKYGNLYIKEIRVTYDSDMYLLISDKFILAIEYILNSYFEHSVQEFRLIENILDLNKSQFDEFNELDIVAFPSWGSIS